jgi:radical SAM protein
MQDRPSPSPGAGFRRHSAEADARAGARPYAQYGAIDFNLQPFTVAWEITRACALKCVHCRAEAIPRRDPLELTTDEGFRLIDELKEIGGPILVITGGDPMMRRDVYDLISYGAKEKGMRVALSPSATALVTGKALAKAKDCGLLRTHISLDGSNAAIHDAFRQSPGSFRRTVEILDTLSELGMSIQIGTTVSRFSLHDLPAIQEMISKYNVVMWNLFFLVPTGRGTAEDMISPEEHEQVFHWMYDIGKTAPFDVRSTAAMHYRRLVIQRRRAELAAEAQGGGNDGERTRPAGPAGHLTGAGYSFQDGLGQSAMKGVNDGSGFAFVDHLGNVCPSGFLSLPAGNLRDQSFTEIYRDSPLFRQLRDASLLKGKCGLCDFRDVCGGSRARAFAVTGDFMESEPYCVYVSPEAREKGLTAPPPVPRQRPDSDYIPAAAQG